jgi:hypothetical protein
MTLRRAVARHVELVAGLSDFAAFLVRHADCAELNDIMASSVIELVFQVRSKTEADKVIEAWAPAARPLWRNGVYMAVLDPAKLTVPAARQRTTPPGLASAVEPERDGAIFEMHFVPPITEQAA